MKRNFGALKTIRDVIEFQLEGLEASKNKAELLCLMGCMNLIEFMGGVLTGLLGVRGNEKIRFKKGVSFLGDKYSDSNILGEDRMWELRCAITHQYVPNISDTAGIVLGGIGIVKYPHKHPREVLANIQDINRFMVDIKLKKLVSDLKKASIELQKKLKEDKEMRTVANRQFRKLPLIMLIPSRAEVMKFLE